MDAHKVVCPLCCAPLKCDRPIPPGQRLRCPQCAGRFQSPAPSRPRPNDWSSTRKILVAALFVVLLAGAAIAGVLDLGRKPAPNSDVARRTEASQALRQDLERLEAVARQMAVRPEQPAAPAATDGVTEMAHGPIHEAFADSANLASAPGRIVPKPPPALIVEVPPDDKPQGEDAQWIPGYWAWDDDRGDHVWVSGCWRVPPPDHHWEPGHWQDVDQGSEWVSGYWAPTDQNDEDLPAPPDAPAAADEPATPAPDGDYAYDPGCWVYVETHYIWRSGHWIHRLRDRVWVPAHYIRTAKGYRFVNGYWDFPLSERGICFAPVRIDPRRDHDRPFRPHHPVDTNHPITALPQGHAPALRGEASLHHAGRGGEGTPLPTKPAVTIPVAKAPAAPVAEPSRAKERTAAPAVVKPAPAATGAPTSVPKPPSPAPGTAAPRHERAARPSNPVPHTPRPAAPEPVRRPPSPPQLPQVAQVRPSPRPVAPPPGRAPAGRRR
jgi:hypothetical protein